MMHLRRSPLCRACGGAGGTVDHIKPIESGGDPWQMSNLQTMCFDCHQSKRGREAHGLTEKKRVTLVCGPPGAGKTSYVRDRMRPMSDMVLDLDRLYEALSGLGKYSKPDSLLPYVKTAYDAVVSQLSNGVGDLRHAWVISCAPSRTLRERLTASLRAEVVILDTPYDVCMRRISKDPSRSAQAPLWEALVEKWWKQYEKEIAADA
jgi:predicted kinase